VRGVGQQRTEESEVEERSELQWLDDSIDGLVQSAQRAILTKWRLETNAKSPNGDTSTEVEAKDISQEG